ncbi:hypothetical protein EPH_0050580 [Eimeria praecox]|uniref:Uncharacterized protein n=1 Tax=Eimeria praecox TaxID=51316 RepID=U6GL41_9EIME|nr:hypothetical protein EPH_0050580 [Eimeria praecox]
MIVLAKLVELLCVESQFNLFMLNRLSFALGNARRRGAANPLELMARFIAQQVWTLSEHQATAVDEYGAGIWSNRAPSRNSVYSTLAEKKEVYGEATFDLHALDICRP